MKGYAVYVGYVVWDDLGNEMRAEYWITVFIRL